MDEIRSALASVMQTHDSVADRGRQAAEARKSEGIAVCQSARTERRGLLSRAKEVLQALGTSGESLASMEEQKARAKKLSQTHTEHLRTDEASALAAVQKRRAAAEQHVSALRQQRAEDDRLRQEVRDRAVEERRALRERFNAADARERAWTLGSLGSVDMSGVTSSRLQDAGKQLVEQQRREDETVRNLSVEMAAQDRANALRAFATVRTERALLVSDVQIAASKVS
jgi:hypothetical protein